MSHSLNSVPITFAKVTFVVFLKFVFFFSDVGWHNKFNHRVDKHHPNVWHLFDCLQREELSFRHQLGRLKCDFQKKTDDKPCVTRKQIQKMSEDYEGKQSSLIEFLHGLSVLVAKNSKTVT